MSAAGRYLGVWRIPHYVTGPLLVAGLARITGGYGPALLAVAVATLVGGLAAAPRVRRRPIRRIPGFGTLLTCVALLGAGLGAVAVAVPAFVAGHGGGAGLGGLLLGLWGAAGALVAARCGARRQRGDPSRQYAVLLGLLGLGFLGLTAASGPWPLGVVLVLGGITLAPVPAAENSLVGRITPEAARPAAYTLMLTTAIAGSAAGGAVAGLIMPGGVRWAFALAGALAFGSALIVARPGSALTRADRAVSARLRHAADLARTLPSLRPRPDRRAGSRSAAVTAASPAGEPDDPTVSVTGGPFRD